MPSLESTSVDAGVSMKMTLRFPVTRPVLLLYTRCALLRCSYAVSTESPSPGLVLELRRVCFDVYKGSHAEVIQLGGYAEEYHEGGACDWSAECGMRLAKYVAVKNIPAQKRFWESRIFQ